MGVWVGCYLDLFLSVLGFGLGWRKTRESIHPLVELPGGSGGEVGEVGGEEGKPGGFDGTVWVEWVGGWVMGRGGVGGLMDRWIGAF